MAERRLQVFYTVARLLSFTKASEVLHMTQPAVTAQVRQLEDRFRTPLFDRTRNQVTLTNAGRRAYEYAERILKLDAAMENSLGVLSGEACHPIRLGATDAVAKHLLLPALRDFWGHHPEIGAELKIGDTTGVISMVANGMIHLGVVEGLVAEPKLLVEPCASHAFVVITAPDHPLAQYSTVDIETLVRYPLVCFEKRFAQRELIDRYVVKNGLDCRTLNVCFEASSTVSLKKAVEAGMGIAIAPQSSVVNELNLGSIASINLDPPLREWFYSVRQREDSAPEMLETVVDYICAHCPDEDWSSSKVRATRLAAKRRSAFYRKSKASQQLDAHSGQDSCQGPV